MNLFLTSPFTIFRKILEFLNKRIKLEGDDSDEKWITTWNDYLGRLKFLFRWLYNYKIKKNEDSKLVEANSLTQFLEEEFRHVV